MDKVNSGYYTTLNGDWVTIIKEGRWNGWRRKTSTKTISADIRAKTMRADTPSFVVNNTFRVSCIGLTKWWNV